MKQTLFYVSTIDVRVWVYEGRPIKMRIHFICFHYSVYWMRIVRQHRRRKNQNMIHIRSKEALIDMRNQASMLPLNCYHLFLLNFNFAFSHTHICFLIHWRTPKHVSMQPSKIKIVWQIYIREKKRWKFDEKHQQKSMTNCNCQISHTRHLLWNDRHESYGVDAHYTSTHLLSLSLIASVLRHSKFDWFMWKNLAQFFFWFEPAKTRTGATRTGAIA